MVELNSFGQEVGVVVEGWESRPAPSPVLLAGRYVRVVPLDSVHFSDLFDAVCGEDDASLWTYRPIPVPASLADLWMHLAGVMENALTFALVPTEGERAGRPSGIVSLQRVDPATGQVEAAGVLYSRDLQRTRAATEAIHLLMAYAFDDLGYRRFEWKCDSRNEPSRRAALRLGFSYEGRFRNHMIVQGRNRDTDWFSVTSEEWPAVKSAHEAWLAPENFDSEGRQLTSLSGTDDQEPHKETR